MLSYLNGFLQVAQLLGTLPWKYLNAQGMKYRQPLEVTNLPYLITISTARGGNTGIPHKRRSDMKVLFYQISNLVSLGCL